VTVNNGIFTYLNMAPIAWYSKWKPTAESSIFGAEFVAMKKVENDGCTILWTHIYIWGQHVGCPQHSVSWIRRVQEEQFNLLPRGSGVSDNGGGYSLDTCKVDSPADICTKVVPGGQSVKIWLGLSCMTL
jgi:hypothetical protein